MRGIKISFLSVIFSFVFSVSVFAGIEAPIKSSTSISASNEVKEKFGMVPDAIQKDFVDRGWVIEIVAEKTLHQERLMFGHLPPVGSILGGVTITGLDTIYLNDGVAGISANHEMGHYVDMVLLGSNGSAPSDTQEFQSIYNAEKDNFDDSYPKSDAHEYFAEAFSMYVEYPGDLKTSFPKTYDYLDKLIAPYGGTKMGSNTMSKDEKDKRSKQTIKEAFDFDGMYSELLKEMGKEFKRGFEDGLNKGLNSTKSGQAAKKSLEGIQNSLDDITKGVSSHQNSKEVVDSINKKINDFDGEKAGKEAAEKVNNFFGSLSGKMK